MRVISTVDLVELMPTDRSIQVKCKYMVPCPSRFSKVLSRGKNYLNRTRMTIISCLPPISTGNNNISFNRFLFSGAIHRLLVVHSVKRLSEVVEFLVHEISFLFSFSSLFALSSPN